MTNPLMFINFSIAPEEESEFNQFYHREFIPQILKHSPEIIGVRRYEEFGSGGTLRYYNKQLVTIYLLAGEESIASAETIFARKEVADVVARFREWKEKSLQHFSRMTFRHTWAHPRQSPCGVLAANPFFLWQLEMKPEVDAEFQRWYEDTYLPLQVAEIPTWTGCNRYESVNVDQVRHLTFFETSDESKLTRCLTDLRAPNRNQQNHEWQLRVEPAVSWHDAASFRPIFRWPD